MIKAGDFLGGCLDRGFTFYTGTPCSYLKPLINYAIDHDEYHFVGAANEGDAVAIAAGVTLAGGRATVMFQNSGLGNAVNPLTSLTHIFEIPLLILVTHRGEPDGDHDEPQHSLMGAITTRLLSEMQIGWSHFPRERSEIPVALDQAVKFMSRERRPFAFVVRKQDVEPYLLQTHPNGMGMLPTNAPSEPFPLAGGGLARRSEALTVIQEESNGQTVLVGTTGFTSRELYQLQDKENQFYMVGSMGCALPFGLGIALQKPSVRVVVIDGDGALLMRTGTMGTVGAIKPPNLVHILLDNEAHDSTGGQCTVSSSVSFAMIARGFGYPKVHSTNSLQEFRQMFRQSLRTSAATFIRFKIRCGTIPDLPRPSANPAVLKKRFENHLKEL